MTGLRHPCAYAIPSRARSDTLIRKTLPLLDRLRILDPENAVTVFVADDEILTYAKAIRDAGYEEKGVMVAAGATGMCGQRNAIQAAYALGGHVITIDDDMRDLVVRRNEKRLEPIEPEEWLEIVRLGFEVATGLGARLWGLYPVPNPYFMKPRIRTALCYVGGGLYGWVNRLDDGALDSTLEYRDDWERSVKCYAADGAVVRFDYVSWRTEGYAGAGGMQTGGDRTKEATLADCEELARRYPGLVTLNLTKKSGWPETRLRDRRPRPKS